MNLEAVTHQTVQPSQHQPPAGAPTGCSYAESCKPLRSLPWLEIPLLVPSWGCPDR